MSKGIRVAVLHRAIIHRESSPIGMWSYPVEGLQWQFFPVEKGATIHRENFKEFDFIWYEDGKLLLHFVGDGPPVCYWITDSTLSEDHYRHRLAEAKKVDYLFLDWDKSARFREVGKPLFRCAYCVNERLFVPLPKTVDVGFHMNIKGDARREEIRDEARKICARRGWLIDAATYPGKEYAQALGRARVVLNLNRTPSTRNHRVFDAMAAGAALLTEPIPPVPGELWAPGETHYEFSSREELETGLEALLGRERWRDIAERGREYVLQHHTWAVRARQLAETLGAIRDSRLI